MNRDRFWSGLVRTRIRVSSARVVPDRPMIRRCLIAALVATRLLVGAAPAAAASALVDEAEVFSPARARVLTARLAEYEERSGNPFVVSIHRTAEDAKQQMGDGDVLLVVGLDEDFVRLTTAGSIGLVLAPPAVDAALADGRRLLDEGDVETAIEEMVVDVRAALGDDVLEGTDEAPPLRSGPPGSDPVPEERLSPADTPALDAPLLQTSGVAPVDESDADRLGAFALGAVGLLLLIALGARRASGAGGDMCPLCKSTLSFSGGQVRCGGCGFQRLRGRRGEGFFGSAAPRAIDYRLPEAIGEAPPAPLGGASAWW